MNDLDFNAFRIDIWLMLQQPRFLDSKAREWQEMSSSLFFNQLWSEITDGVTYWGEKLYTEISRVLIIYVKIIHKLSLDVDVWTVSLLTSRRTISSLTPLYDLLLINILSIKPKNQRSKGELEMKMNDKGIDYWLSKYLKKFKKEWRKDSIVIPLEDLPVGHTA